MTYTRPGKRFRRQDVANYGLKPALIGAIALHVAAFALLFAFGQPEPPKPLPKAIPVGLAKPSVAQAAGGKKSKAAVARSAKNKPKTQATNRKKATPTPKKKTPSQPAKKRPSKKEVGTKTPKKSQNKDPEPEPAVSSEHKAPKAEDAKPAQARRDLGGTGGVEDHGVAFDVSKGQADLSQQDSKWQSYLTTVHDAISRRWAKAGLTGGLTSITFHIHRDGSISNVELTRSSGKAHLDGPAKRAVLSATLPPLPQGYLDEYLVVTLNFRY